MSNPPPIPTKPKQLEERDLSTRDAILSARRRAGRTEEYVREMYKRLLGTTDSLPPMRGTMPTQPDMSADDSQQLLVALTKGVIDHDKVVQADKSSDRRFQVMIVVLTVGLTAIGATILRVIEAAIRGHW